MKETSEMIFEKITAIIIHHIGVNAEEITLSTTFEELGVDSLDTVEMVMKLEEELGIELEMEGQLETVGDLVKYVESKISV